MRIKEEYIYELKCLIKYNTVGDKRTYVEEIDISGCDDMEGVLLRIGNTLLDHGSYILQDEVKSGISIDLYYELVEG